MAQDREDVVSVFVCGSMAQPSPPDYADVDLRVVIESADTDPSFYEVRQQVPLEWVFVPRQRFDDLEDLLSASFLPSELVKGVIVYDPTGWLQGVRDEILSIYELPSYRIGRSQRLLDAAKALYEQILKHFEVGQTVPLWDVRCAIFWTGETPSLLLNEIPNHRRLMVDLKAIGERLDSPGLYPTGIETVGADRVERSEVEHFLVDVLESITYINAVSPSRHFHLSLEKREYWADGIARMLAEGYYREALWPMLTLISAIQPILAHADAPESSEYYLRCRHFLDRLGFLSKDDFQHRLMKLDEWIDTVDALIAREQSTWQGGTLNTWLKKEKCL